MTNPVDAAKRVDLTTVAQDGTRIRLESRITMTVFIGSVEGNEIAGEWKQFGAETVPLTPKKMP
jgi:fibronectin type 3 domain-containing protein